MMCCCIFFFKQKTAYDMRISDWSSDVCSSDLLNFSDVVDEGLGFDNINGHFDLGGGAATTDDLKIKGPSVKIDMGGRIGLVARDYDLRVAVYPAGLSSGVTHGAALLGGPAVGALVLLAQAVLEKTPDSMTQLTYHVYGGWDNPQFEKIDSHAAEQTEARKIGRANV